MVGSLRLGEMRLRTEVDRFNGLVKGALHHVEAAAEKIANGKTVTKSGLSDAIKIDCRHAHDVLSMTIAPIVSNSFAENQNWTPGPMAKDTAWSAVKSILFLLGGDGWPDRAEFPRWLTGTVLPVLRFAVHGEELPGFEAERIVHVEPDPELASASDESAIDETASDLGSDTELEPPLADERVVAIEAERRKRRGK